MLRKITTTFQDFEDTAIKYGSKRELRKFAWLPVFTANGILWLDWYTENQFYISGYAPFERRKQNGRWVLLSRHVARN